MQSQQEQDRARKERIKNEFEDDVHDVAKELVENISALLQSFLPSVLMATVRDLHECQMAHLFEHSADMPGRSGTAEAQAQVEADQVKHREADTQAPASAGKPKVAAAPAVVTATPTATSDPSPPLPTTRVESALINAIESRMREANQSSDPGMQHLADDLSDMFLSILNNRTRDKEKTEAEPHRQESGWHYNNIFQTGASASMRTQGQGQTSRDKARPCSVPTILKPPPSPVKPSHPPSIINVDTDSDDDAGPLAWQKLSGRKEWYMITRSRAVGVFEGWETVAPHVVGVSTALYRRVRSRTKGDERYRQACTAGNVVVLS
ncbi:hypothetical protein CERSUDRAFT_100980 [Gelatoporia subvermispora B]|uniref:Uncharacterized protein n=1 Tax=Ceriporiopsis subvermispora (strain B) TaxID=914234 RepID=M2P6A1_CERS8|nr:hypothetical protein CERSUDRAFT_100980 [Gelatoporia subvermispora B]